MAETIIKVSDLDMIFTQGKTNNINVLRKIDLDIYRGEIISIVGESGSGKSVFLRTLIGLNGQNAKYQSGSIQFENEDLTKLTEKKWEKIRGRKISMIFQDPMNSLNPVMKIEKQFAEIFKIHFKIKNAKEQNKLALEYLNKVKINNPERVLKMYPHELSGGMKQRIVIGMVLACKPEIILADEPTTAIDATVQSEILKLLLELQKEFNLTIVFVTHDMGIVSQISDRIAVMYGGKIIELGTRNDVIKKPAHPYTRALLAALPSESEKPLEVIPGTPPNLAGQIKGDAFAPRNKFALEIDFIEEPPMMKISDTHQAATWLLHEDAAEAKAKFDEYYQKIGVINE